jgi:hypothetical protein
LREVLRVFVDSDRGGEQFTKHSRTAFVIYLKMAPIVWYKYEIKLRGHSLNMCRSWMHPYPIENN